MAPGAGFDSLILGSLGFGVVAIDAEGRIASLNAGAQRILGCPDGERGFGQSMADRSRPLWCRHFCGEVSSQIQSAITLGDIGLAKV